MVLQVGTTSGISNPYIYNSVWRDKWCSVEKLDRTLEFFDKGHKRMISMCKSITFLKSYEVLKLWKMKISWFKNETTRHIKTINTKNFPTCTGGAKRN
jgi:hypothetical protein